MPQIEFTQPEQEALKRALVYVLSNAPLEETVEVLGNGTYLTKKFGLNMSELRDKVPDYVLHLTAKEVAILTMTLIEAYLNGNVSREDIERITKSLHKQSLNPVGGTIP